MTNDFFWHCGPGDERFLLALRSFLDRRTKDDDMGDSAKQNVLERELFITNGVSHGLELLCATLTQPGDEVWVERPTYFLAPKIFESNGIIVKPLPMMSDRSEFEGNKGDCIGCIDIDRLICMVEEEGVPAPKMIYIIPAAHNPTGRWMTVEERRKLASFACRNGIYLLADEVYHLLDWVQSESVENHYLQTHLRQSSDHKETQRPAGIVHFNDICNNSTQDASIHGNLRDTKSEERNITGCCISVSSFTKIWAPGIRLGWIDAPSYIIHQLKQYGYIDSQGGVAPLMGRMMTHAIEFRLLDSYLDKLIGEYSERYELVSNLLKEEPRIAILSRDSPVKRQGGYFIWVQFPTGVNGDEFLSYCMENYGVKFMSGDKCDPFASTKMYAETSGKSIRSCARLCYADLDREDLISATKAFIVAFRSYMVNHYYAPLHNCPPKD